LIDRYGIVFAFHVTAAMQAAALLPLLFAHAMGLVPAEAADASGGASADVGAEGCGGGRADADDADGRADATSRRRSRCRPRQLRCATRRW
jgi:hypothetical protein